MRWQGEAKENEEQYADVSNNNGSYDVIVTNPDENDEEDDFARSHQD